MNYLNPKENSIRLKGLGETFDILFDRKILETSSHVKTTSHFDYLENGVCACSKTLFPLPLSNLNNWCQTSLNRTSLFTRLIS